MRGIDTNNTSKFQSMFHNSKVVDCDVSLVWEGKFALEFCPNRCYLVLGVS